MFIRPLSDVHNEFSIFNVPPTDVDHKATLVLAGDIGVADTANGHLVPFFDTITDQFANIVYIPGNHEYYHGSLLRVDEKLDAICKRYSNIFYMNRKAMKIMDVLFIGATLWTDLDNGNPLARMQAQDILNDYRKIRTGSAGDPYRHKITATHTMDINRDHRKFLAEQLSLARHSDEQKIVVFTHHSPTFTSRHPEVRPSQLDHAYFNSCGMEDLMLDYQPNLWIHGHTHYPADFMFDETRIVANPRGYARYADDSERSDFNRSLVIEL